MSTVVDLKTKEEKDAELDKRIEALRKKNEALVKRYQEIQEDKKKAEQEGISVTTSRKPRSNEPESERRKVEKENLTVTVDLSKPIGEKRVVNDRKPVSHRIGNDPEEGDSGAPRGESPPRRAGSGRVSRGGQRGGGHHLERREPRPEKGDARPEGDRSRGGRRGGRGGLQQGVGPSTDRKSKEWEEKRRQNIEKMNEEMEKIAEYERGQRTNGEKNPTRNFLDDPRRSGPVPDTDRKEGSRRHVRNWGGLDFDNVKTGGEMEKEWTNRRPGGKGSVDMTLSMTGRERAEYLRWKKEREQIDEERLARHRNATGQWRREWDAQKTDAMFKEDPAVAGEAMPETNSRTEDSKRPPKAPTIGDFLEQGKPREVRGGRGRGKGRSQGKSYSMHDNRWEEKKKEENVEKEKEKKKKEKKPKAVSEKPAKPLEKSAQEGAPEDDDDEWQDASDGEEVDEEEEVCEEEEVAQKDTKPTEKTSAPSTPSPKDQRTPRPKVRIPSPQETLTTPEPAKPLSPFSPPEGHQPVSDWGEEMEMQSPKSSIGESPLRPSSNDSSPAQAKSQEQENAHEAATQPTEADIQDNAPPVVESAAPVVQEEVAQSEPAVQPAEPTPEAAEEPVVLPVADSTPQEEESAAISVEQEQKQPESETAVEAPEESLDQPCSG